MAPNAAMVKGVMVSEHDEDGNKQVSGETESLIIQSEIHSRSSSSSSSSSSYLSPTIHLPEDNKEPSSNDVEVSPTDSPPVQVMDRDDTNDGYDPNRIPSSVFERQNSNVPADWSCTSNESLFSIHLGRNSFTVDLMKSGELFKSGELLAYSPALPMPPPPGEGGESNIVDSKVVDSDEKVLVVEDTHKTSKEEEEEKRESPEKEQHPAVSWKTPSTSYRSNRSSNSTHSFSFPILAGAASESGKKETEEQKKQAAKQSEESQQPEDEANQKQKMCRWCSCFPPCPWCCSSRSSCSCS